MSIYIQPKVYVRIEEFPGDNAPRPLPLRSGFSEDRHSEVLGIHTPSESAEAFLILKNDRDEMWFISNRHCRIVDHREFEQKLLEIPHMNGNHGLGTATR
jgi:hypothetical protein